MISSRITQGTDGHEYLLTPTALGAPQTVPEPSTLLIFGFGAAACIGLSRLIVRGVAVIRRGFDRKNRRRSQ